MKSIFIHFFIILIMALTIIFLDCVQSEKNYSEPTYNQPITTSITSNSSTQDSTTTSETTYNNSTTTNTTITGIVWITIPSGTFVMGNHWSGSNSTAHPAHTVQISGFQMTETEITVEQYCQYLNLVEQSDLGHWNTSMSSSTCGISRIGIEGSYTYVVILGKQNYPINYVSWNNAKDFCQFISGTLPTESQWEFCAGGTNHYMFSLSNTINAMDYCLAEQSGASGPCPVKSYGSANSFGLWDMTGNIFEWCVDWFSSSSYGSTGTSSSVNSFYQNCLNQGTVIDPVNIYPCSSQKPVRGGCWLNYSSDDFPHVYARGAGTVNEKSQYYGFRCVK